MAAKLDSVVLSYYACYSKPVVETKLHRGDVLHCRKKKILKVLLVVLMTTKSVIRTSEMFWRMVMYLSCSFAVGKG